MWVGILCFVLCLYFYVFGLVWFPIRGSCQSLSLIENHTWAAWFRPWVVGSCFLFCVYHLTELFRSRYLALLFCLVFSFLLNLQHEHLQRCTLVLSFFHLRRPLHWGIMTHDCTLKQNNTNKKWYTKWRKSISTAKKVHLHDTNYPSSTGWNISLHIPLNSEQSLCKQQW